MFSKIFIDIIALLILLTAESHDVLMDLDWVIRIIIYLRILTFHLSAVGDHMIWLPPCMVLLSLQEHIIAPPIAAHQPVLLKLSITSP